MCQSLLHFLPWTKSILKKVVFKLLLAWLNEIKKFVKEGFEKLDKTWVWLDQDFCENLKKGWNLKNDFLNIEKENVLKLSKTWSKTSVKNFWLKRAKIWASISKVKPGFIYIWQILQIDLLYKESPIKISIYCRVFQKMIIDFSS